MPKGGGGRRRIGAHQLLAHLRSAASWQSGLLGVGDWGQSSAVEGEGEAVKACLGSGDQAFMGEDTGEPWLVCSPSRFAPASLEHSASARCGHRKTGGGSPWVLGCDLGSCQDRVRRAWHATPQAHLPSLQMPAQSRSSLSQGPASSCAHSRDRE